MIETKRHIQSLTLADLPGPDTRMKRAALTSHDSRQQSLLRIAAEAGWPEAYADDLYRHDLEMLAANPGTPMLWILRANGTHLYPLECHNTHEAQYYRQVIHYWSGDHRLNVSTQAEDRARYFVITGADLTEVTADEAKDRIRVKESHD